MPRIVLVEIGDAGLPIRILKNEKQAVAAGILFACARMTRSRAVESIRHQIWERDKHTCTHCGVIVGWHVMQMHERLWRGRGGEISLDNGTTLCNNCHADDPVAGHGKRKIQWSV